MAYYIFPNTSSNVSHTTPLTAKNSVSGTLPPGHTIQWRQNGVSIKTGSTSDPFYSTINTGDPLDVNFSAVDDGTYIDFLIDPVPGPPDASQTLLIENQSPVISGAGVLTDSYSRTTGRPTLVWTYSDPDNDPQFQYRVKFGSTIGGNNFYDSGIITLNAATTFYLTIPTMTTAIPDGTLYYWTLEVSDGEKINPFDPSPSAARVLTTANGTGVVNTAPVISNVKADGVSGGGTVTSVTPTITWTYSDIDSQPQSSYRIIISRNIGLTSVLWDSGVVTGSSTSSLYNFNLTGIQIESHITLYVGVKANDGLVDSAYTIESFVVSGKPVITTVTVDSKVNPLNIRTQTPFFNWLYTDIDNDPLTAFEIRVSEVNVDWGTDSFVGNIWSSGVVITPESYGVRFNFDGNAFSGCTFPQQFQPGVIYYFQVQVKDGYETSEWAIGYFKLNAPPTAANLQILPVAPFTSDSLLARYDFIDDIGDVESPNTQIRWFRKSSTDADFVEIPSLRNQ